LNRRIELYDSLFGHIVDGLSASIMGTLRGSARVLIHAVMSNS
jgi:hypothetical protein